MIIKHVTLVCNMLESQKFNMLMGPKYLKRNKEKKPQNKFIDCQYLTLVSFYAFRRALNSLNRALFGRF